MKTKLAHLFSVRHFALTFALLLGIAAFVAPAIAQPGTLDPNFGTSGIALRDVSTADDQIFALATQSDSRIIAVGHSGKPAQFTIARFFQMGSVDTTFGTSGVTQTVFSEDSFAYAVGIQADEKIVVAGEVSPGLGFAIARYTVAGQLDTTFGNGGTLEISTQGLTGATGLVIQSDGKIVVVGNTAFGDFAVIRLSTSGVLDPTFGGGDGIEITDFFGDEDRATAVRLQSDGKLVVAGSAFDLDLFLQFAIARYNTDGTLDTTFNSTGKVNTLIDCGADSSGCGVDVLGIQPDGKIVVATSDEDVHLARYNSDGSASGSVITTDIGGSVDDVGGLHVDLSGNVILAGSTEMAGNYDFFAARYQVNGGLDPGFDGGDGIVVTPLGSNSDLAHSIAVQPTGGIILGGSHGDFGSKQFALIKYIGLQPTAASVELGGRVTTASGQGIRGAVVTLMDQYGNTTYATTGSFGYYRFFDVEVGQSYILSVSARRYTFAEPVIFVNLMDEYLDANFVAN